MRIPPFKSPRWFELTLELTVLALRLVLKLLP